VGNATPRVFISYSHDSAGHKVRVLELANRLRAEGVDARLDRYVSFPAEGWPRWMRSEIEAADAVLLVCTVTYRERFDGTDATEKGPGARWEGLIITQALYEGLSRDQARFIPVLFDDTPPDAVPISLRPFTHFRLPKDYDALYRVLTNQPDVEVPSVGNVRTLPPSHLAKEDVLPVVSAGADTDLQAADFADAPPESSWRATNDQSIEVLRERWQARRLTLILGAGVSVSSGLPTWAELLNDLLASYVQRTYAGTLDSDALGKVREVLATEFQYISPIQTAEFIQSRLSSSEFVNMLRTSLYRRSNERMKSDALLDAVVSLSEGLHGIVSFNFDDILEEAFTNGGVEFTTVIEGRDLGRIRGIPIYHPHGYLPRDGHGSSAVVFAESEYHTQYAEGFSWTNIVVQRLLLESTCLFVGTSLSDPNLRRMIDLAHRQNSSQRHYYVTLNSRHPEGFLREAVTEILQASYEATGVVPVWMDAYEEIPHLLLAIRTA